MGWLESLCLLLGGLIVLGFFGAALWVTSLLVLGWMVLIGSPIWLVGLALIPILILNVPVLRARLLSSFIMKELQRRKLLPTISDTEQIALDAGSVWVDGDLFSGKPDLKKLADEPYPIELSPKIREFLDGPVEELCRMTSDWQAFCDQDFSPEIWDFLRRERFFGLIVPEEHGGLGLGASELSAVVHKLASRSFPLSVTVMIPNSLGPAELLQHYGTEEQKQHYLPRLAGGDEVPCFALTEPKAGSDAGSLGSKGVVFRDDSGELKLRLSFRKRYTSLAARATLIGLAIKIEDPDDLLGRGQRPGITCVLVPAETEGIRLGRRHDPLGVPFFNCPLEGDDVIVSADAIIGGAAGAGQGWRMLMECLAAGRGVALPASSVAMAKVASRVTGAYAMVRQQFGMPVGRFEGIEEPLARIGGKTYLMEAARSYTCGGIDAGHKPSVISAIMKLHHTEMIRSVVNDSMDVLAGAGISRGPRNTMANYYSAMPIGITVEGANILTRCMIIFGQGAIRCHPHALSTMRALAAADLKAFDRAFFSHAGHVIRNTLRASLLSLSRGWLARSPRSGPTARYWRRLAWSSASFAVLADLAMLGLGGDLKRKEKLTGRLGDVLSWMYMTTSTLRRFDAEGAREEDRPLMEWAAQYSLDRVREALSGIHANFPVPVLSQLLRGPMALWGRMNSIGSAPDDRLGHEVASLLCRPSPQRDRLNAGLYHDKREDDAARRLERAFELAQEAGSVLAKIRAAMKAGDLPRSRPEAALDAALEAKVIDPEEAKLVRDARAAREDAVTVDSFALEGFANATPRPGGQVVDLPMS